MKNIRVGLEWFLNPDHLPLVVGKEKGWFHEEGVNMEWIEPEEHFDALDEIKAGNMEIAITEPIHLAQDVTKGEDIIGFARFFHSNGGIMYLNNKGINSPKDLVGKRIQYPGAPGKGGLAFVKTMVEADGGTCNWSDFTPVNNGFYHTDALLEDKADAALLILENFEMVEAKHKGADAAFFPLEDWDVPDVLQLIFVTTPETLEANESTLKTFLKVMRRAIDFIHTSPEEAKDIYLKVTNKQDDRPMLDATVSRFTYDFSMTSDYYDNLQRWLQESDQIDQLHNTTTFWTNKLLFKRI